MYDRQEKSRALAKGNRDEQLFKRLFQSSVKSEREMLREEQRQREGQLRKQAVDKRVKQGAVKKYWQDQAEMLEEKIQTERRERREVWPFALISSSLVDLSCVEQCV